MESGSGRDAVHKVMTESGSLEPGGANRTVACFVVACNANHQTARLETGIESELQASTISLSRRASDPLDRWRSLLRSDDCQSTGIIGGIPKQNRAVDLLFLLQFKGLDDFIVPGHHRAKPHVAASKAQ